ncbi:hypothetical protein IRT04_004857 [Salmonella enterica]|nr:hypothetical protein [Salmonella enterica]
MSGISINTRQLADLLNISEGELVHAMRSSGELHGVPFPDLLGNHKAKARKFNLTAALRFVDQVNKARSEGGNSESS